VECCFYQNPRKHVNTFFGDFFPIEISQRKMHHNPLFQNEKRAKPKWSARKTREKN